MVETVPGEGGEVCAFETTVGDTFTVTKPQVTKEQEAAVIEMLREILEEAGGL